MAMVVKNNMSAVSTLNTLNKNSSALQKSLSKVSSGMKINSAQDDASGYAISERMRVQIRSLDQANQNTQNGSSLMKTAEGAVSSTVEILKSLKEKAINAANDTNKDSDRATIQKEIDQFIDQIDDNALTTFNGKYLVDGSKNFVGDATKTAFTNQSMAEDTKYNTKLTDLKNRNNESLEISSTDKVTASYVKDGKTFSTTYQVSDTKLEDIFKNLNTINGAVFGGANTTKTDMALSQAESIYKQNDDASATQIAQEEDLLTMAQRVYTKGGGNAAAELGADTTNTLTKSNPNYKVADGFEAIATLATNGKLDKSSDARETLRNAIKTTLESSTMLGNTTFKSANALGTTGTAKFTVTFNGYDANSNKATDTNVHTFSFEMTGSGTTMKDATASKMDEIVDTVMKELDDAYADIMTDSGITPGTPTGDAGDATKGSDVLYQMLQSMKVSGDTTVWTAAPDSVNTAFGTIKAANLGGAAQTDDKAAEYFTRKAAEDILGSLVNSSSDIGLATSADMVSTADSTAGLTITAAQQGVNGQVAGVNISITDSEGNVKKAANASLDKFGETIRAQNKSDDNALSFQVGAEANVAIKVGMTDMRSEALGLKGSDGQKLSVATRTFANAAVNVIDNAIQKAVDQQTTIGSIEARLSYTSENLTVSSENTQAAESTIRDADMAKEMTNYTKNNVLLQAAQSMLAQANQSSSAVLSLLQ